MNSRRRSAALSDDLKKCCERSASDRLKPRRRSVACKQHMFSRESIYGVARVSYLAYPSQLSVDFRWYDGLLILEKRWLRVIASRFLTELFSNKHCVSILLFLSVILTPVLFAANAIVTVCSPSPRCRYIRRSSTVPPSYRQNTRSCAPTWRSGVAWRGLSECLAAKAAASICVQPHISVALGYASIAFLAFAAVSGFRVASYVLSLFPLYRKRAGLPSYAHPPLSPASVRESYSAVRV
ncbi:hypothetical protein BHM03_00044785 [Ensete ventricosum]|nr:hypothetical protein BHM03_00044785 [Ensete ventricosum]